MTGALAPGRGRDMRPRSKKPGAVSRPGGWRSFGEYAFLEDSRYTSQEGCGKTCILRLLRRAKLEFTSALEAAAPLRLSETHHARA